MIELLEHNRDAIAAICGRHGVQTLYAFGSALRDDFRPGESDIDLLVELGPMEPYARVDAYFGMLDELRARGAPFDLLDAVLVGGDPGVVGPAAAGPEATPGGAQGPVAQQVAVEVGLVVAGLCGVDPDLVLWGCLHGASLATGRLTS